MSQQPFRFFANKYELSALTGRLSSVHYIAVLGLLIRISVAVATHDIYHADEIFQYLEQAHRLTFGYGYIPWEYRFGTRSWSVPGLISGILALCKGLRLDDPAIYTIVVEIVFCTFSISLIYSSFVIARETAGPEAGQLAALFSCVWYELVYFAHKPLSEVLSTYLMMAALACSIMPPKRLGPVFIGSLLGAAVVLRLQYLSVVPVVAFFLWIKQDRFREVPLAGSMFLVVIALAGYLDHLTWGSFFASFHNNYLFNAVYGVAGSFGTERLSYFLEALTIASMGLFALVGLMSCKLWSKTWLYLAVLGAIVVPHSLIPHKEYRFIFAAIPLFLILLPIVVSSYRLFVSRRVIAAFVAIVCCLSFAGLINQLPGQRRVLDPDFEAKRLIKEENLEAYLFLNNAPNLVAVLNLASDWALTGGYYYLHRDVPIYRAEHLSTSDDLNLYVSHIVCARTEEEIPGFVPVLRMRQVEVRQQIAPPSQYANLGVDTKNVLHRGIDDRFIPTVKKRL